jgi:hypothetical protein
MPKIRGKYKRYLTDNVSQMPRQTRFNQKKKEKSKQTSLSYRTVPEDSSSQALTNGLPTNIKTQTPEFTASEKPTSLELTTDDAEHLIEHADIVQSSSNEERVDKDDLCIAILSAFYSGKITQSALNINMQLFNIIFENTLPRNFNSLSTHLLRINGDKIAYDKRWYCNKCNTSTEKLESVFQRMCSMCNTR